MLRIASFAAVAAIAGLLAGTWYYTRQTGDVLAACRASAVAGGAAAIGGPFTLTDETGATVTERDVIDRPTLIYFGYSYCPDVCPMDLARNAMATDMLSEMGVEVKPVFISVDPARDTPAHLAEFTSYMHEDMQGLTGTPDQLSAAMRAYKGYFRIHEPEDPAQSDFYLVDHSTFTYLMLPSLMDGEGTGFAEFFRREDSAEEMADRVACFVEAAA